ncbi:MarR family transcriptional regulator, partial [Acinetobacter baumannii]
YCLAMLDHLEQFLPNKEPSSIQNFPFFWISQVNGKYSQLIEKSIKKLGIDNTRRKIILSTNALGEASITDIANLSTLKLTTATKAVYRLVEDGIVEVYSSTADERISMVKLTAKGVELVEQINQISVVTLAGILNAFSEEELHNLNHQLKKLFDLMPSS